MGCALSSVLTDTAVAQSYAYRLLIYQFGNSRWDNLTNIKSNAFAVGVGNEVSRIEWQLKLKTLHIVVALAKVPRFE